MKILITGGTGFLGKHLVQHLREVEPAVDITVLGGPNEKPTSGARYCDLRDPEAIRDLVAEVRPDEIYHLAGHSRVTAALSLGEYFENNYLTTLNLLNALTPHPVRLLFASSVHVYGNQTGRVSETAAAQPLTPYGFTKYLCEQLLIESVKKNPHLTVRIIRLFNCIGPGQAPGFVTSDLCQKLVRLPDTKNAPLKVGQLDATRQFLDARDAVRLIRAILKSESTGQPRLDTFNLASPKNYEIREILTELIKISGKSPLVESETKAGGNPFLGVQASPDKLLATFPDAKFRPLTDTLRDLYDWTMKTH